LDRECGFVSISWNWPPDRVDDPVRVASVGFDGRADWTEVDRRTDVTDFDGSMRVPKPGEGGSMQLQQTGRNQADRHTLWIDEFEVSAAAAPVIPVRPI
jgi:hypothetical protein